MKYRAYMVLNGVQESESVYFDSYDEMEKYFQGISTASWDYEDLANITMN